MFKQKKTVTTSSLIYAVPADVGFVNVDASNNPVTIILPNIRGSYDQLNQNSIYITDISNCFAINNCTIVGSKNSVNFNDSVLLSTNGMSAECLPGDITNWIVKLQSASGIPASSVSYNNSQSGLTATNVQEAIDELAEGGGGGSGSGEVIDLGDRITGNEIMNLGARV